MKTNFAPKPEETFVITHTFDAPRDKVWSAWTDPAKFAKWFGPKGFTCKVKKHDLQAGGFTHTLLTAPDGTQMWGKFVYQEVEAPKRLVWIHSFSDKNAGVTRHPFHIEWPLELYTTVTFEEQGNKTKITLTWTPYNAKESERGVFKKEIPGMQQGWGGTFEQLTAYLAQ